MACGLRVATIVCCWSSCCFLRVRFVAHAASNRGRKRTRNGQHKQAPQAAEVEAVSPKQETSSSRQHAATAKAVGLETHAPQSPFAPAAPTAAAPSPFGASPAANPFGSPAAATPAANPFATPGPTANLFPGTPAAPAAGAAGRGGTGNPRFNATSVRLVGLGWRVVRLVLTRACLVAFCFVFCSQLARISGVVCVVVVVVVVVVACVMCLLCRCASSVSACPHCPHVHEP